MNMQNKLYTIQFSHHPMIDLQSVPEKWSWKAKLTDFANSIKCLGEKTNFWRSL